MQWKQYEFIVQKSYIVPRWLRTCLEVRMVEQTCSREWGNWIHQGRKLFKATKHAPFDGMILAWEILGFDKTSDAIDSCTIPAPLKRAMENLGKILQKVQSYPFRKIHYPLSDSFSGLVVWKKEHEKGRSLDRMFAWAVSSRSLLPFFVERRCEFFQRVERARLRRFARSQGYSW